MTDTQYKNEELVNQAIKAVINPPVDELVCESDELVCERVDPDEGFYGFSQVERAVRMIACRCDGTLSELLHGIIKIAADEHMELNALINYWQKEWEEKLNELNGLKDERKVLVHALLECRNAFGERHSENDSRKKIYMVSRFGNYDYPETDLKIDAFFTSREEADKYARDFPAPGCNNVREYEIDEEREPWRVPGLCQWFVDFPIEDGDVPEIKLYLASRDVYHPALYQPDDSVVIFDNKYHGTVWAETEEEAKNVAIERLLPIVIAKRSEKQIGFSHSQNSRV